MKKTVLLVGATGLIGRSFLEMIKNDNSFSEVILLLGKEINSLMPFKKIRQYVVDFENLHKYKSIMKADVMVSTIGTAIGKTGIKKEFEPDDFKYYYQTAEIMKSNKTKSIILVSSVAANENSVSFYLETKGKLENAIKKLNFENTYILRPSLLLDRRKEFRFFEKLTGFVLKKISFFIPWKYKAVTADTVAKKILEVAKNSQKGLNILEGRNLR